MPLLHNEVDGVYFLAHIVLDGLRRRSNTQAETNCEPRADSQHHDHEHANELPEQEPQGAWSKLPELLLMDVVVNVGPQEVRYVDVCCHMSAACCTVC